MPKDQLMLNGKQFNLKLKPIKAFSIPKQRNYLSSSLPPSLRFKDASMVLAVIARRNKIAGLYKLRHGSADDVAVHGVLILLHLFFSPVPLTSSELAYLMDRRTLSLKTLHSLRNASYVYYNKYGWHLLDKGFVFMTRYLTLLAEQAARFQELLYAPIEDAPKPADIL